MFIREYGGLGGLRGHGIYFSLYVEPEVSVYHKREYPICIYLSVQIWRGSVRDAREGVLCRACRRNS